MSVTIVAMDPVVNSTVYFKELANHIPVYAWPKTTQSLILSSFFIGYLLANFPASVLGCRFNNKVLLACSMTVASLLAIISPSMASWYGAPALICVRFAQGLFSAFVFPMVHGIMAKWVPPNERSQLVGFIVSGIQLGTMTSLAISGILSSSNLGWPVVYYLSGAAGLVWVVVWTMLGAESLTNHRFISQAEKDYIEASLMNTVSHDIKVIDLIRGGLLAQSTIFF